MYLMAQKKKQTNVSIQDESLLKAWINAVENLQPSGREKWAVGQAALRLFLDLDVDEQLQLVANEEKLLIDRRVENKLASLATDTKKPGVGRVEVVGRRRSGGDEKSKGGASA